jgi:membrane-associated PAP2 superfamily phosphatase
MTPARLYAPHLAVLALSALALAVLFHYTRLDLRLAAPWYDPVNHTFPWRYAWITKYAIHRHLKVAQIVLGVCMCLAALYALRARDGFFATHRRRLWCVALSFVFVPVIIAVLRRFSPMHCPWDVVDFGGYAPYFDLFQASPPNVRAGRCFPAAFVASGSWMLSFAWLWFPERRRLSAGILLFTLAWAFGLGWVQQMRGAHFLSHTLWSLWVSWLIVLLVHFATGAWREMNSGRAS